MFDLVERLMLFCIFSVSIYSGVRFEVRRYFFKPHWPKILLAVLVLIAALPSIPIKEIIASLLIGFFVGFIFRPEWILLKGVLKLTLSLIVTVISITAFVILMYAVYDKHPEMLTAGSIFVAGMFIWMPLENLRRAKKRKEKVCSVGSRYFS